MEKQDTVQTMSNQSIKSNLEAIKERIKIAAIAADRNPSSVRLIAVSKKKTVEAVLEAASAGATIFGENYIQESIEKAEAIDNSEISWHFIGHLQSNKAKFAVKIFDLIHSVDSFKLAKEINKQAKKIDKIQNILVQVNISMEETKSGISEEEAEELVKSISHLENISVKGLMTMPPYYNEPELVKPYFKTLKKISEKINALDLNNISMKELSMGMTGDFEPAIAEGSTFVRIGTAIFGSRY